MASIVTETEHDRFAEELTISATDLGWTVGLSVSHCSVSAHRWGTDAAGGEMYAVVIGNADGWHYFTYDERGNLRLRGSVATCATAMRAALPFNHTDLNP